MSRPHGYVKFKIEGCHCAVCRAGNATYIRHRNRMMAYGRWQPYVDAEPARQHVRTLQATGLGWKRIAQLAEVHSSVVCKLLYGSPRRGPSDRIRPETARKLLSVRPSLEVLGGAVSVDAVGTQRRVRALVARGWSQSRIARQLGMSPANFGRTMRAEAVSAGTAKAVRELYDQLWNTPPPEETHRDKIAASRARNHAKKHGWPPALAWDDDTIDDPAAEPSGIKPERRGPGGSRKLPPSEDIRFLLARGESREIIAKRYGVTVESVNQTLRREQATA